MLVAVALVFEVSARYSSLGSLELPCGDDCGHILLIDSGSCAVNAKKTRNYFAAVLHSTGNEMYLVNLQNMTYLNYSSNSSAGTALPRQMALSNSCDLAVPFANGVQIFSLASLPTTGGLVHERLYALPTPLQLSFSQDGLLTVLFQDKVQLYDVLTSLALLGTQPIAATGFCGGASPYPSDLYLPTGDDIEVFTMEQNGSSLHVNYTAESSVQAELARGCAVYDKFMFSLGSRNNSDLITMWTQGDDGLVVSSEVVLGTTGCGFVNVVADTKKTRVVTCTGLYLVNDGKVSTDDDLTYDAAEAVAYIAYPSGDLDVSESGDRVTLGLLAALRSGKIDVGYVTQPGKKNIIAASVMGGVAGVMLLAGAAYYLYKRISIAKRIDQEKVPLNN